MSSHPRITLPMAFTVSLLLAGTAGAQPLPPGYEAAFHEADNGSADSVTLRFEDEEVYRYDGMMVPLDAARDRTGDGRPEIVLSDMTSRSTTT